MILSYVKKILYFLSPIFIILISFEFYLSTLENDYSFKNKILQKEKSNIHTLFLGNSHVYYGISPSVIDSNSFNAAHISQTLKYDFLIFKKFIKNNSTLKKVFISIDYHSFASRLEESKEKWRIASYFHGYSIFNYASFFSNFFILNKPVSENIELINLHLNNQNLVYCTRWGNRERSDKADIIATAKNAAKRHTTLTISDENIDYLNSIIEIAKSKNIEIIIISLPVSKYYYDLLDKQQLQEMQNLILKTCKSYNLKYHNLMQFTLFDNSDFRDADHLNKNGAIKLSKFIKNEL